MARPGTVTFRFLGDASQLERTFKDVGGKMGGFGKKVGLALAAAGAAAGAAGIALGKFALETGASLEAMDAKAKTVFGDQIGLVETWAKNNAAAMGLTKTEATGLAAGFADLLVPMGFTRKQAADMSTDVIGLSGALSEWSGGQKSASDVADILSKAMLGERDGLKSLGISITEEDVKQRLLKKGQEDLTGAALAQAKAMATQELIFEKSTDAQDAYAKGTAKGLRAQAEFRAKIGEVKEAIARGLYPIVVQLIDRISELAGPVMGAAQQIFSVFAKGDFVKGGPFQEDSPFIGALFTIREWFLAVPAAIRPVVDAVTGFVDRFRSGGVSMGETGAQIGGIFQQLKDIVGPALDAIRGAVETMVAIVTDLWQRFGQDVVAFAGEAWDGVMEVIRGVLDAIKGVFDVFAGIFTGDWGRVWDGLKAVFTGIWDGLFGIIRTAIFGIGDFFIQAATGALSAAWSFVWNSLKTLFDDLWDNVVFKGITAAWGVVVRFFTETVPRNMKSAASGMWDWIVDVFRSALNALIRIWNGLEFKTPEIDLPGLPKIGGQTIGVPDIPYLHQGGIVPGRPGEDVLAMLRAGERVTAAGAAANITINAVTNARAADIAAELAWTMRTSGV